MNVAERLTMLGELFEVKDNEYGSSSKVTGEIIELLSKGHWQGTGEQLFLAMMVVNKLVRAVNNVKFGHNDSLNDLAVYAQMWAQTYRRVDDEEDVGNLVRPEFWDDPR